MSRSFLQLPLALESGRLATASAAESLRGFLRILIENVLSGWSGPPSSESLSGPYWSNADVERAIGEQIGAVGDPRIERVASVSAEILNAGAVSGEECGRVHVVVGATGCKAPLAFVFEVLQARGTVFRVS